MGGLKLAGELPYGVKGWSTDESKHLIKEVILANAENYTFKSLPVPQIDMGMKVIGLLLFVSGGVYTARPCQPGNFPCYISDLSLLCQGITLFPDIQGNFTLFIRLHILLSL